MEIKKSDKANLENKKLLFTELGLIVSLAITFGAFEYTSKETKVSTLEDTAEVVLEVPVVKSVEVGFGSFDSSNKLLIEGTLWIESFKKMFQI